MFRNEDWTGLKIPSTESCRWRKAEIPSHIKAAGAEAGRSYLTETSASARGVGILHSENVPS